MFSAVSLLTTVSFSFCLTNATASSMLRRVAFASSSHGDDVQWWEVRRDNHAESVWRCHRAHAALRFRASGSGQVHQDRQ